MSTRQPTIDFLLEQLAGTSASARSMFGEYGLYLGTTLVGLVCDDQLYLKPTPQGRALIGTPVDAVPYPGAKPSFLITADRWENADWLKTLLAATASALPAAKPKAKSPAKAKTTSP